MSTTGKWSLRSAAVCALLLWGQAPARASVEPLCSAGSLCLLDQDTGRSAGVWGDNRTWREWNNRADVLSNRHRLMNVCVYPRTNYWGVPRLIPRGVSVHAQNYGASNRWTTATRCPPVPLL